MTRLRILAVLSNAVVWIVSTHPPTSKSSRPFNNPLVIVPNAPITIGTIVTFMFHSFFNSLSRTRYLAFFSLSFRFILWSAGTAKSTILLYYYIIHSVQFPFQLNPRDVTDNVQDCNIVDSEFEIQAPYCVHLKNYEPHYPTGFGFKFPTKGDMPLEVPVV